MKVVRRYGLLALGLAGVIVGAVLMLTFPMYRSSFGWTAYAPLSDQTYAPLSMSASWALGFVALTAGLVLIAGWVGFALGRRRVRDADRTPDNLS